MIRGRSIDGSWEQKLFFFQAEDGIRDLVRSRGLGDVYKRQELFRDHPHEAQLEVFHGLIQSARYTTWGRQYDYSLSLIHI